ncbi:23S rRNA (guanosine(2251)-2'-O)-methyltransferase RlmB [Francisella frigiditurris]|uniref:RNA 2'-O ribose methyltransferase substrate binding family protein n=1 Tax=Francisella frigiditurris TaxID=1542390 RepID=A0A1J0KVD3_9GAMM|nr:23S rRNA (guanosine(2251)-2'-O)-methyltransferase RlmB [Francisella frigiditurris]APC97647.1 RNA 2'-O ribose methyltransferase substrate binding family protein [Francisella frigiditurris]
MSSLVYGIHAVESLIKTDSASKVIILNKGLNNPQIKSILDLASEKGIKPEVIDHIKQLPERLPRDVTHQGVFAYSLENNQKMYDEKDLKSLLPQDKNAFILILDSVQDPHNLGACIRTAHSAGVDFLVIPKDNSATVNATVKKVACGAAEHLKIVVVTNLSRAIEKLKEQGVWVIGLAGEADESLYDMNLQDSIALVAGSEGKGMRQKTKANCDFLAKLPMYGEVSSLNVSVASGISMYEVVRQRNFVKE